MTAASLTLPPAPSHALQALEDLADRAQDYAEAAHAPETLRAYRTAWRLFSTWCEERALVARPAHEATIALYVAHLADAGRAFATIQKHLAAIAFAHLQVGAPLDLRTASVKNVRRGVARTIGTTSKGKAPCEDDLLAAALATLDRDSVRDVRDRAILAVGFFAARRRSELVALDVADCRFVRDGLELTIRRSKTDPTGEGLRVGVPFARNPDLCAVRALRAWLELARITEGAVFRPVSKKGRVLDRRLRASAVPRVLKRCLAAAGHAPEAYAGHSLRAGFVTAAARKGKPLDAIMRQTGHKSVAVAMRYVRPASVFLQNAATDLA